MNNTARVGVVRITGGGLHQHVVTRTTAIFARFFYRGCRTGKTLIVSHRTVRSSFFHPRMLSFAL